MYPGNKLFKHYFWGYGDGCQGVSEDHDNRVRYHTRSFDICRRVETFDTLRIISTVFRVSNTADVVSTVYTLVAGVITGDHSK